MNIDGIKVYFEDGDGNRLATFAHGDDGGSPRDFIGFIRTCRLAVKAGTPVKVKVIVDENFKLFSADGLVLETRLGSAHAPFTVPNNHQTLFIPRRGKGAAGTYEIADFTIFNEGGVNEVVPILMPAGNQIKLPNASHTWIHGGDPNPSSLIVYARRVKWLPRSDPFGRIITEPFGAAPFSEPKEQAIIHSNWVRRLESDNGELYIFEFRNMGPDAMEDARAVPINEFEEDRQTNLSADSEYLPHPELDESAEGEASDNNIQEELENINVLFDRGSRKRKSSLTPLDRPQSRNKQRKKEDASKTPCDGPLRTFEGRSTALNQSPSDGNEEVPQRARPFGRPAPLPETRGQRSQQMAPARSRAESAETSSNTSQALPLNSPIGTAQPPFAAGATSAADNQRQTGQNGLRRAPNPHRLRQGPKPGQEVVDLSLDNNIKKEELEEGPPFQRRHIMAAPPAQRQVQHHTPLPPYANLSNEALMRNLQLIRATEQRLYFEAEAAARGCL